MPKLLSIIIPVYNEEKIIATSLPAIFSLALSKEIIIINDGSSDNTLSILKDLNKTYPFKLIDQAVNRGKGEAVKLGLEVFTGDYFIICDADLEYAPEDIIFLWQEIEKIDLAQPDKKIAVYGSRFLNKPKISFHYLINKFLTRLTNILFSSQLTDMETCFKLIPRSFLETSKISGRRFEIEPEITAKLLKNNYQIIERPVSYCRRTYLEGKKIKARDGLLAIKTLLAEYFN
ncbi:MAG: glycosyltransferase family 2 protein [Candidatus Falkowbacteria bacterium]